MMYNAHSYAYSIERMLKLPMHSADEIARNPLGYLEILLNKEYDKSDEKARLIDKLDAVYGKYNGIRMEDWEETDAAQFVKDLREVFSY